MINVPTAPLLFGPIHMDYYAILDYYTTSQQQVRIIFEEQGYYDCSYAYSKF
jgi:hypothetical protein